MDEEVFNAKSVTVEQKQWCEGKKASYWKFKIDGKTMSMFERPPGEKIVVGDTVNITWTEKQGTGGYGGPVTYRNLRSISLDTPQEELVIDIPENAQKKIAEELDIKLDGSTNVEGEVPDKFPKDTAKVSDYKTTEANKFSLGMSINGACIILADKLKLVDGATTFDEETYITLVKQLYEANLKLRNEKMGY